MSHTSECREISWQPFPTQQRTMPQQIQVNKAQQEGRIELALQAYKDGQFQSLRRATNAYNVSRPTLQRRYNGTLT